MKKLMGNKFIVGIAALLIGLALLCFPEDAINVMLRIIGVILLIGCAVRIVAFVNSERGAVDYLLLVLVAVLVVLGILLLICPKWIVGVAFVLFGILVAAAGVLYMIHAFRAPNVGSFRFVLIGIAVVAIVLGIVVVANPFDTAKALTKFAGFSFLVSAAQSFLALAADQKAD